MRLLMRDTEKRVICIYWVDKGTTVSEKCGTMPVAQTNADTIVISIKFVLLCMNLRIRYTHGHVIKDV